MCYSFAVCEAGDNWQKFRGASGQIHGELEAVSWERRRQDTVTCPTRLSLRLFSRPIPPIHLLSTLSNGLPKVPESFETPDFSRCFSEPTEWYAETTFKDRSLVLTRYWIESHAVKKARLNGPSAFINPYASKSNANHKSSASGPSSIPPNRTPLHCLEPNESSQLSSFSPTLGVIINLTDPNASPTAGGSESSVSPVAWSATDLSNTTHKLVLTMASQGNYIVADGFIFTVDNGASPSSTSTSASETTSPTSAAASAGPSVPAKHETLAIAIGACCAALLGAAVLGFFIYRRRNRARESEAVGIVLDDWYAEAHPPPPVPFVDGPESPPSKHDLSMPDVSVLTTPGGAPVSQFRDDGRSTVRPMSVSDSIAHLPPGAHAPAPAMYTDDDLCTRTSSSIARTASSPAFLATMPTRQRKSRPNGEEIYAAGPPAYSES
ncbi:hypothetical protein B0H14DRAFT_2593907 [Mycena olivaceomarginata]|nr:hypothetical protein B0H14DRAFT_2593907 [Mycena olivaceomarginata]